jgi:hypothetical protein
MVVCYLPEPEADSGAVLLPWMRKNRNYSSKPIMILIIALLKSWRCFLFSSLSYTKLSARVPATGVPATGMPATGMPAKKTHLKRKTHDDSLSRTP